jgi:hypothetical protein
VGVWSLDRGEAGDRLVVEIAAIGERPVADVIEEFPAEGDAGVVC